MPPPPLQDRWLWVIDEKLLASLTGESEKEVTRQSNEPPPQQTPEPLPIPELPKAQVTEIQSPVPPASVVVVTPVVQVEQVPASRAEAAPPPPTSVDILTPVVQAEQVPAARAEALPPPPASVPLVTPVLQVEQVPAKPAAPAVPALPKPTWEQAAHAFSAGDYEQALQMYRSLPTTGGIAAFNAGVCLRELGRHTEAAPLFQQALAADPDLAPAQIALAWSYLHLRRAPEALALFEQHLARHQGDLDASKGRAQALHLAGRLGEAKQSYQELLQKEPGNPDLLANLIAIAAETRDLGDLRLNSSRLFAVRPRSRQALAGLITAEIADKSFAAALKYTSAFLEVEPKSYEAWFNFALASQLENRLDAAEKAYRQAIEINPDRPEALLNLGCVLYEQGELAEALNVFHQCVASDSEHGAALWNLALTFEKLQQPEAAETQFVALAKLDPARVEPILHLGYSRFQRRNWNGAMEAFTQCLEKRPNWPEVLVYLGLAQWYSGDLSKAAKSLDAALKQDPVYLPALQCRIALALFVGDLQTAPELEAQLADLGQTLPEFCYDLGLLQHEAKQYEAAAHSYRRAIGKRPAFSEALLNLGYTLEALGRHDQALEAWKSAISADPDIALEYLQVS